jgi:RNA polymerase sigma factor (sigma-70 family)
MMTNKIMSVTANNDAELVSGTLAGNRDAFGQIVSRYQSLICSLAYSATGSLGQSEDLAQETFITAWKHLGHLRERDKLRSWLCGIARNRINNFLRREGREPNHQAESIEEVSESHSPEPLPVEHIISNEEQAILWRSLERIPEIYREPLVLFYREHQSIEAVAEKLELTEDNVKQRLSRGRKLLHEQVLAFVEGALERTNPGKTFTLGVLAALPATMVASAKAATLAAAAKGAGGVKAVGAMGVLGAILSPLLAIFGNYASYKMSMDEAETDEERFHIKKLFRNALVITLTVAALLAGPLFWMLRHEEISTFCGVLFSQIVVVYFLSLGYLGFAALPQRRRHLARMLVENHGGNFPPAAYEFRSRASLFGLPLLHVRLGDRFDVLRGPVKAWIAIGSSHSVGVIFASGGIAVAPVCFGGIGIGIFSFSAISLGIISIGAIAFGGWAYGAFAAGWQIFAGCGMAWNAGEGGLILARDFALGAFVHAAQANTEAAKQFIYNSPFFRIGHAVSRHGLLVQLAWIIPMFIQARVVARARRRREQAIS